MKLTLPSLTFWFAALISVSACNTTVRDDSHLGPDDIGALIESLRRDEFARDPDNFHEITRRLITIGSRAVPDLASAMEQHEDEVVRRQAALILGEIGDPSAEDTLIHSLRTDEYGSVRFQSAVALGKLQTDGGLAVLIESLESEQSADVRSAVVYGLGHNASPQALDALSELLVMEREETIRKDVAAALGYAATDRAVDMLRELADDENREVAAVAKAVLKDLGG